MVDEIKSYAPGEQKQQVLKITNKKGETQSYSYNDLLGMGINLNYINDDTKIYSYTDAEGNKKLTTDITDVPMSIHLNTETGDIDMNVAPEIYNSAEFQQTFDPDTLKKYSQAYKLNNDYKITVTEKDEETGETVEKGITIPEYIEKLNEALEEFRQGLKNIQNYRGSLYAKYGDKVKNMNLAQIQMSLQYDGDSIYFPAELLRPSKIGNKDNFFKDVLEKVDENGLISIDDLKEVYTRSNIGREEFASIMALIDGTLKGSEWGPDTYKDAETGEEVENQNSATRAAKLLAFRNFILANNPDSEWWQQAGDQIESFIVNAAYGVTRVFGNIANIAQTVVTLGNGTEVQNGIKAMDDAMEYYNTNNALVYDAVANAQILGMIGGSLGATFAAGYFIGGAVETATGKITSALSSKASGIALEEGFLTAEQLSSEAYTASVIASLAADAENISKGARITLTALSLAEKTQLAINTASMFLLRGEIGTLFKGETALASIGNWVTLFLADTFHDALLYDSTTFRDVMLAIQSSDVENKETIVDYWLRQLAENALFWIPMGFAKTSIKLAGKTALGIAANQIATKYINKFVAAAGNHWSNIRNNLAGGNLIAKLNDQLKKAEDAGNASKANHIRKKIGILFKNELVRDARKSLGDLELDWDGVKLTEDSLNKFNDFLTNIKAKENAIDLFNYGTSSQRSLMLNPQVDPSTGKKGYVYPELAGANNMLVDWEEGLVKLNKKYGLSLAADGSQISQDVIDYWQGTEKLKRLEWTASHGSVNAAEAQANLETARANVENLRSILPDEIVKYVDRGIEQKLYAIFYTKMNEVGYSGKLKVLDKNKILNYESNPMWQEVGYSPVKVKIEDRNIRYISEDGTYESVITEDMYHMTYHVSPGEHYEDPMLLRQIRINHMAEARNNVEIRHLYCDNSNATFITEVAGSETALVGKFDDNAKALKIRIDEQVVGAFDPEKTTTTFSIQKTRRRAPVKNITVDDKTMGTVVAGLSPSETSQFLCHKHVIASPTDNLTDGVTAETYDAWYDSQNKSVKKFLKKQYREINRGTEAYDELLSVNREKKSLANIIEDRRKDLADLGPKTKPVATVSALSYDERKELAKAVVRDNPEYMLLYRVQDGKPDKWRPNNRGVKGKFEATGGELGLKGAVWLTADGNWAEGKMKASAGVGENVTNENIVVLPVKKSDILNLNHETLAKPELDESGKKIVKTRGINNGLEESEYILWKNEHPEIFSDGMKKMLDKYNEKRAVLNKRFIRRTQDEISDLESGLSDLEARRKELYGIVNGNSYDLLTKAIEYGGQDFQDSLKRAYLMGDKKFAESNIANEAAKNIAAGQEAFYQGVVVAKMKSKLKNILNVNTDAFVDELYDSLKVNVDEFVRAILEDPAARAAINALADTVDGSEEVARYLALQSLAKKSNLDKAKDAVMDQVKERALSLTGLDHKDVLLMEEKAAELLQDIVYTEYDNATLVAKTIDPDLVDGKDVYDRVKEIRDRIEGAEKRVGQDYIAFVDDNGQLAYAQVDPALASLYNYRYKMQRAEAGALAKANAVMSKAFRLGTTSLSLASFGNQAFRDSGNTLYVAGAWKTIQANADNLVDVFGRDIVEQIKMFEPDDFEIRQIIAAAEANGQTIEQAAVSRELMRGAAKSPASTERILYKNFLKEVYGQSSDNMLELAQSKIKQILKKWNPEDLLHGKRENYLRNRVYASVLNDSLTQGYTLQQARIAAEYAMNNATTNFGREIYHLQAVADSTPYFRAAINGTKSFWRMWTLDPVGITGRVMGGLVIPVMFFTGASLADEKNREVYKNIPEYVKSSSFVFVHDGHAISIPLPQELGPIVAPFRQFVEHLYNTNKGNFWELMSNDLLGFSPYDLTGFTAIDYDAMVSDPTILDRISRGSARLFSQMAPVPVRSAYMLATGTDPYTGRDLRDPSYMYWDEETGALEVMDYNGNAFAQWVASLFGEDVSPKLIERVVSGILGTTGSNLLSDLATIAQENNLGTGLLSAGGHLVEQTISPITVNQYNLTDAVWKRAINQLTDEKVQLLNSKEMKALNSALATEKDPEQRKKILSQRQTLVDEFQQRVGDAVKRLNDVYHGTFDRKKFAAVIQLLNFNSDPIYQSGSQYSSTTASDQFWDGRDAAIHTMQQLGVTGTNDFSIFGYLAVDKQGNPVVKYTSPVAIMDMEAQWSNQNDVHLANIKALATQNKLWDKHEAMMNKVNAIYNKNKLSNADYDAIDDLYVSWNAEVMQTLAPYIEEMTPEAAINNNQVLDYLDGLIEVPGDFKKDKNGKYVTNKKLGNGSATQAYIRNYIKYIFGVNDTAYSSGKNYSDRVNYNKETSSWK